MFPDSQIAKQYKCAKTKSFYILIIINRALTQSFHIDLVSKMKVNGLYTLATDGSNDSDLTKIESFDRKNIWHLF